MKDGDNKTNQSRNPRRSSPARDFGFATKIFPRRFLNHSVHGDRFKGKKR